MTDTGRKIVLDTNVLLHSDIQFEDFEEKKIILPIAVLEELDGLKKGDGELGFKARKAIRLLEANDDRIEYILDDMQEEVPKTWEKGKRDNLIIAAAIRNNALLISNDLNVRIKAKSLGLEVDSYRMEEDMDYKGYKIIEIDTTDEYDNRILASVYESPEDNSKFGMMPNEYLIFRDASEKIYCRFSGKKINKTIDIRRWNGEEFVELLRAKKDLIEPYNDLQACAIDLILNKDVPIKILAGVHGSGKTMIATTIGYDLVAGKNKSPYDESTYDKLVLVRNNDMAQRGDPGALPGTLEEKTDRLFQTMTQYIPMGSIGMEELRNKGILETHITYFIKGLTINGFMLVDEAEDLTVKDIKRVGSRIGDQSCVVLCGDWKQSNGIYFNDNGLRHTLNETRDNILTGAVILDMDVRSSASKIFADL